MVNATSACPIRFDSCLPVDFRVAASGRVAVAHVGSLGVELSDVVSEDGQGKWVER